MCVTEGQTTDRKLAPPHLGVAHIRQSSSYFTYHASPKFYPQYPDISENCVRHFFPSL